MGDRSTAWLLCEFAQIEYTRALSLQRDIAAAKHRGRIEEDLLLMLEHPPVFTLGRRGGRENLTVSEAFLSERDIPVVQIERGGNITYHGPGQLVLYPIVSLARRKLSVTGFVEALESVMIRIAADFGVSAVRDARNRGVWVKDAKLGSIGINIRHGVAFHGLALNVNTDLAPFSWIRPCGLSDVFITSLAAETGAATVAMEKARQAARSHFEAVFGVRLEAIEPAALERML
ncbi:MAG: lipoyl(octanoyl) transferase LipB [Desulfobacterales bacterium]|nr:lipoyl(octanoyl) transferase LipB [Desulfobacterales bacterium]